jgi:protein TonB
MQSLYSYLKWAIKYPKDAWKNNIQGKVYLTFTVEKDGSIANVEVKRSLYPSLDNEAMRVIRQAPKWIPGRQNGFPVKVKYNIPISFSL